MSKSSSADKLLEKFDRKSGMYFRLKAGERRFIRLLPSYDVEEEVRAAKLGASFDAELGVCVIRAHKMLPKLNPTKEEIERAAKYKKGAKPRSNYRCLQDLKKPCGLCQFFENLGKEDKDLKFQFGVKPQPFADFYVKDIGACQRWFFGKMVLDRLLELTKTLRLAGVPPINDPVKGRSLIVSRTGSGQFDTEYALEVSEKVTKLPISEEQYLDDILDEVKNYTKLEDPAEVKKVLKMAFPELV